MLEGYLDNFVKENRLEHLDPTKAFEQFSIHCIVSKILPMKYDFDDINVGEDGNPGIDGLAILVNDRLVLSKEDIDYFIDQSGSISVHFIFLQAKTSTGFDQGDISKFIFAVKNIFAAGKKLKVSETMSMLRELIEYIYSKSINLDKAPKCSMFYITCGRWDNPATIKTMVEQEVNELKKTSLFSEVLFNSIDADKLKMYYKELKNKSIKEINLEKHTILPKIDQVAEAYLGILPAKAFIDFISDCEGNIQKSIFYDNIRDFQGYNPVNKEINETVTRDNLKDKFVLFNNGITIVAKSVNKVGTSFKLIDYQVVNGCQTSHVLYDNKKHITDNVFVTIKLIITDNSEITSHIIMATNRQTEVKSEAFEALSAFHKSLEDFYNIFKLPNGVQLHYERRSQQYAYQNIPTNEIISLTQQIKCFIAMFLDEPHSTHRYYGELLKSYRTRLFVDSHSLYPYFLSTFTFYMLDIFIFEHKIDPKYKKYRQHILMLIKYIFKDKDLLLTNRKDIEKECKVILDDLNNQAHALELFKLCCKNIDKTLLTTSLPKNLCPRMKAFTEELISNITTLKHDKPTGKIIYYNVEKGFGFIKTVDNKDLFFHISSLLGETDIEVGNKVNFEVQDTYKGDKAVNILKI